MLEITFLGTGSSQGIPTLLSDGAVNFSTDPKDKRLRSSVMITYKGLHYLIDCGPDFRTQMIAYPFDRIDAILFTHEHADHTAGLDDIRAYCYQQGSMPIYGEKRMLTNLSNRFPHIFATENRYPGAPSVTPHIIDENTTLDFSKDVQITPIRILHGSLPILGYRFKNFAYLTDTKEIPEHSFEKLQNLKVLVISAFRIDPHRSHLNLQEALAMIKKINPETAYITHIGHSLGFHKEVSKDLPKNVFLAYDGLKIHI